jgi:RNA polymerase sigma-70 factor, ECF subfamily
LGVLPDFQGPADDLCFDDPVQPQPLCRLRWISRFRLEAAVQSVHCARQLGGRTDWPAILELYDGLIELTGSPVVAVNRAVALGETAGPAAGLAALDEFARDPRLVGYQPYWAARADLLAGLGRRASADAAYAQAILLEPDAAVRRFLEQRRARIRPNFA